MIPGHNLIVRVNRMGRKILELQEEFATIAEKTLQSIKTLEDVTKECNRLQEGPASLDEQQRLKRLQENFQMMLGERKAMADEQKAFLEKQERLLEEQHSLKEAIMNFANSQQLH